MAHWSGIGIPKTNAIALEVSYTHTHTNAIALEVSYTHTLQFTVDNPFIRDST